MAATRTSAQQAADAYVAECGRITRSGEGTDERSFYPALNSLLTAIGELTAPRLTTIPEPAAREGDFPDLGVYEQPSQVLVLPAEVKPTGVSLDDLRQRSQPARYARSFGGDHVLLTNLHEFAWAELNPGSGDLVVRDTVTILSDPEEFQRGTPRANAGAGARLVELLDAACALRATITDADRAAHLLAYHAARMLEAVEASGDPQALLRPLADGMRDGLGMELEDEFFTPTIVQTLIYAMFAAWIDASDPTEWNWRDTGYQLRIGVIAELFHEITDPAFVRRCDLTSPLDAAARVLKRVDRDRFAAAFDEAAIEYFYEPFLARFDPELRNRLGVWYTPREIAEYQVRRADHHLREDLEIRDGLADDQVFVLDPACGTGTYLRAVLDRIYQHHVDNGEPPRLAAARARSAALERVIGFDVLPAAFVIAHLHLHRHLAHLDARLGDDERLRVYLTNSLTGWGADAGTPPPLPLPGLEQELRESLAVKHEVPVLVVLGNPPYEGYSAADTEEERALLSDWTEPLWPEYGLRKHRLGDLYVRFWRIAVRKIAELTGRGIVTYIANRKWLGGRSFPAMRDHIVHAFHRIIVDDLHGDVHDTAHPGDGSVFTTEIAPGIQRGVAITTCVRVGSPDGATAMVLGRDLRGSGAEKRARLAALAGEGINEGLEERAVSRQMRWKLIASAAGDDPCLDEYFDFYLSGVQPVRDEAVMDSDPDRLAARMRDYFSEELATDELIGRHPGFGIERARYDPPRTRELLLADAEFERARIVPFLYRPFDLRWLYWETRHKLLNEARRELLAYYVDLRAGELVEGQYAIVASQTPRRPGAGRPTLTSAVPSFHAVDPDARVLTRIAPAQRIDDDGAMTLPHDAGWRTNVRGEWLAAAHAAGIEGDDAAVGDAVFYALIAVMYAPSWADAIGTDNDDFAPVPLPAGADALLSASRVGRQVASLADPVRPVSGVTEGQLDPRYAELAVPDATDPVELTAGNRNAGGRWVTDDNGSGAVLWDDERGWRNVPRQVWEFSVGGFQVLPKWLGYRHSRREHRLTAGEITEFTHLVRRIAAILDLSPDCEQAYQAAVDRTLEPPAEA